MLPRFDVISTTPLAALMPYSAVPTASFKTLISLISLGFSVRKASEEMTLPSNTYKGSLAASPRRNEELPRIRIWGFSPSSPRLITTNPGTLPCKAIDISIIGLFSNNFILTVCTTPDFARMSSALMLGRAVITASPSLRSECSEV